MPPLSIALIGLGGISRAYVEALADVPDLRLLAGVDTDPERRSGFSAARDVPVFADVGDLVERNRPDAAVVMTPPTSHEPLTVRLLEAGVHVLCEKPLAVEAAAAERMAAAAKDGRRTLMMASKFRYVGDLLAARELLQSDAIGRVLLFENAFCSRVDMTQRWNGVHAVAGGGVLLDNGTHSVDVARFLCGPLLRIQAQFGPNVQELEVEDTARLLFEAESGAMGSIDLSWSLHKESTSYVRVYGSRGTLEIGWKESRHKLQSDAGWTTFGSGYDKIAAFRNQLEDFALTIRGQREPRITVEDALWSVRSIEAAYRSARSNKWMPIVP